MSVNMDPRVRGVFLEKDALGCPGSVKIAGFPYHTAIRTEIISFSDSLRSRTQGWKKSNYSNILCLIITSNGCSEAEV